MEKWRKECMKAISKLPDSADSDDILYRLYVVDKIRKGKAAVTEGKVIMVDDLKKEIKLR